MKATTEDREYLKAQLTKEIINHVGEQNAIDMGDLYRRIYGKDWANKINDTRPLRQLITELKDEGVMILSSCAGYYIAQTPSEAQTYLKRRKKKALKILAGVARMEKTTLPLLIGQMQIDLSGAADDAAPTGDAA
jgi:hypothetical protein